MSLTPFKNLAKGTVFQMVEGGPRFYKVSDTRVRLIDDELNGETAVLPTSFEATHPAVAFI